MCRAWRWLPTIPAGLRLVAEGHSNRDIAGVLFISAKTASVHVSNILAKLESPPAARPPWPGPVWVR